MKVFLFLYGIIAIVAAVVIVRDGGGVTDDGKVSTYNLPSASDALQGQPTGYQTTTEMSTHESALALSRVGQDMDDNDVIEIYLGKDYKGQYYYYTAGDTDTYYCKPILRLVGEHLNSVYQKRPKGRSLVRCHYFAMDDCTDRLGEMTHGDQEEIWKQPDLSKEPRYVNGNVVGSWYDAILSVQCFWVHATTESSQTSATSTDIAAPTPRADPTLDSLPESSTEDSEGPSPPDLVSIYVKKEFHGQYYYYNEDDTTHYACKNINPSGQDGIASVWQIARPDGRINRCHYYAQYDCGFEYGRMTWTGPWQQRDLSNVPRIEGDKVYGTWLDQIRSVQCFWVHANSRGEPTFGEASTMEQDV